MAKIYLASSWRNQYHTDVLEYLTQNNHKVYNFKSNTPTKYAGPVPTAFSWAELDKNWTLWTQSEYRNKLVGSPRAQQGFIGDYRGMEWADICVLLMPSGRSAHIEAGYMKGRGKRLIIHYEKEELNGFEPDLMYLLADNITIGKYELLDVLL